VTIINGAHLQDRTFSWHQITFSWHDV
jgi:hypothetical protein